MGGDGETGRRVVPVWEAVATLSQEIVDEAAAIRKEQGKNVTYGTT